MIPTFTQRLDYMDAWNADIFARRRAGALDDQALAHELAEWRAALDQLTLDMAR